jgi:ubiquinone/menaquinone biosynthesis C-methylase UbiE
MGDDVKRWLNGEGEGFFTKIGVKKGQVLVDFGCGAGNYTIPVAKIVGKEGKVFAVDKDREVLAQLMQMARSLDLKNVVPVETLKELKNYLQNEPVDVILLYDVLHYMETEKRREVYKEIYEILKIGGLLSVYPKHNESDEPLWNFSEMKLETIMKEIESANFCFKQQIFNELIHDDKYDKGIILNFAKANRK